MKRYRVQALFALTTTIPKEALLQTQPDGATYYTCLFAKCGNNGQKLRLNPTHCGDTFGMELTECHRFGLSGLSLILRGYHWG
jgi:hypothetical protein